MNKELIMKLVIFILITLIVTLIGFPVMFNFLFLWESGWANGKTSDWFTFYANIFGGLVAGLITFISLWVTIEHQNNKDSKEIDKEKDRIIKNFVVNSKYYSDKIDNSFLNISNSTDSNYSDIINGIGKQIDFREDSFIENGHSLDAYMVDIDTYKGNLRKLESDTYEFVTYLKNTLSIFVNDEEFYKYTLNLYLMIDFLNRDIAKFLDNGDYTDLDFLYNFISFEPVGYLRIIRSVQDDIDALWEAYVDDSESKLSNYMLEEENLLPHIKG